MTSPPKGIGAESPLVFGFADLRRKLGSCADRCFERVEERSLDPKGFGRYAAPPTC